MNLRAGWLIVGGLLVAALAAQEAEEVQPTEEALTLEAAVTLALAQNPLVQAARESVRAAQQGWRSEAAMPNPEFALTPVFSNLRRRGRTENLELELFQVFETSGRRAYRDRQARGVLEAAQHGLAETELELMRAVKQAYFELLAAQQRVAIAQENVALATRLRDLAQRRLDIGDAPRMDVVRAEIERARAQQELIAAEPQREAARAALNTVLGRPPETPVTVVEVPPEERLLPDLAALQPTALQQRPALRAAEAEIQAARAAVDLAQAERRPDLEVALFQEEAEMERGVLFRASWPLFDRGRIKGLIGQARAVVRERERVAAAVRQGVGLEVEQAFQSLAAAVHQRDEYRQNVLVRAEELVRMAEVGYQEGRTGSLEVIDAQRALAEARREYLERVLAVQLATAELERASGGAWPGGAETGGPGEGETGGQGEGQTEVVRSGGSQ